MYDVIVIGGGAAGMVASIEAKKRKLNVLIIEQCNRLGNKIYATGNGRCNMANSYIDESCFRGDNPQFIKGVISCFGYKETLDYFQKLGLYTTNLNETYIYPASKQARSVVHALTSAINYLRIDIKLNEKVTTIYDAKGIFRIKTSSNTYESKNVIMATGGVAGIKKEFSNVGYEWIKKMNHNIVPTYPSLVPLVCEKSLDFNKIAGVRVNASAKLFSNNKLLASEEGELQITNYGVSGIMIFSLSRYAIKEIERKAKPYIVFDFAPGIFKTEDVINVIDAMPYKSIIEVYEGFMDYKLAYEIICKAGFVPESKSNKLSVEDIKAIDKDIHNVKIYITGYMDYSKAQVTMGGVETKDIDATSMESKKVPGLYFTGEFMDMDGKCGGYNLMWAWATGYIAGTHVGE